MKTVFKQTGLLFRYLSDDDAWIILILSERLEDEDKAVFCYYHRKPEGVESRSNKKVGATSDEDDEDDEDLTGRYEEVDFGGLADYIQRKFMSKNFHKPEFIAKFARETVFRVWNEVCGEAKMDVAIVRQCVLRTCLILLDRERNRSSKLPFKVSRRQQKIGSMET